METSKEDLQPESNYDERDYSSYDYDSYDKETLIRTLKTKDELILQKDEDAAVLQRRIEKLTEYNAYLRNKLSTLSFELQQHLDNCSQLKSNENEVPLPESESPQEKIQEETETDFGEKPMPDWVDSINNDTASSISDVIRATAEAELKNMEAENDDESNSNAPTDSKTSDPDYVYDTSSGYYYHASSGYYWDPNSGLFYDYRTGIYYQYDETKGEYEIHSQLDSSVMGIGSEKTKKQRNSSSALDSSSLKRKGSSKDKMKHKQYRRTKNSKPKDNTRQEDLCEKNICAFEGKDMGSSKNLSHFNSEDESSGSLATDESELMSDPESGEIVSSSSSDVEIIEDQIYDKTLENDENYSEEQQYNMEEMAENYPPCIRAIVQESEKLCAGTLFIITCAGGTIGRDASAKHVIEIPDLGVSKSHASVEYDYDSCCYKVTDLGSQNGTRVNTKRICEKKSGNSSHPLSHDDVLQVGSVSLLLHIHKGHETCEDCEPGQIQAKLKALNSLKNAHVVLTKEEKKQQQKKELKKIKKKYGLQNSYFENEGAVPSDPNYTDKAHLRRKFIGSEAETTRTDSPASVHSPIASTNKGHKLLAKMGWKEGQGLGKANAGIAEPINVELRVNQNAGLGANKSHSLSLDRVQDSNKVKRWSQAQQRYNRLQLVKDLSPQRNMDGQIYSAGSIAKLKDDSLISIEGQVESNILKSSSESLLGKKFSKPQISWHKGDTESMSDNVANKDE